MNLELLRKVLGNQEAAQRAAAATKEMNLKPYDGKLECIKIVSEDDMDAKAAASGAEFAKLGENKVERSASQIKGIVQAVDGVEEMAERISKGTEMARRGRAECNKLTEEQRKKLLEKALKVISPAPWWRRLWNKIRGLI